MSILQSPHWQMTTSSCMRSEDHMTYFYSCMLPLTKPVCRQCKLHIDQALMPIQSRQMVWEALFNGKQASSNGEETHTKDLLTPAQEHKEPPFFGESWKDDYQHEVQHHSLTQHPAEHSQEQVVKNGGHHLTSNLQERGRREDGGKDQVTNKELATIPHSLQPPPLPLRIEGMPRKGQLLDSNAQDYAHL